MQGQGNLSDLAGIRFHFEEEKKRIDMTVNEDKHQSTDTAVQKILKIYTHFF